MSRGDWYSVAATLLVGGAAYFIGGAWAAAVCIFLGMAIVIVLHFTRDRVLVGRRGTQHRTVQHANGSITHTVEGWRKIETENEIAEVRRELKNSAVIGHSQWRQMASDFEKLPNDIWAEWTGQVGGDVPVLKNRWHIRGGNAAEQCEALCKLAGAMLLRSPRASH